MNEFYTKIALLDDAMVVQPATNEDITAANEDLKESVLITLPNDYIDFLKHCNGFAFNGVELYGTDIVTDTETSFQLIDIISFTEESAAYYESDLLYFGRVDDDLFTYNPKTNKFEIRDNTSFEVWNEFETLSDFIKNEIDHYL